MERYLHTNVGLDQNSGSYTEMGWGGQKGVLVGQRKRNTRKGGKAVEKRRTQKEVTGNRERKGRYCNER